ncbi:MAG: hypothetical protein QGF46_02425 [Planctomycetota bacterium]|jgi:hypothetical protein|nr:hypothetical protein [Planctomycetota bacterium]
MVLSFEDTPLFDWFKKNRISIIVMLAIIFGGNAYFYYAPGLERQSNADAWALYQSMSSSIDLDENLNAQLAQAELQQTTYPWFVYAATRMALQENNGEALESLKPRLKKLSESGGAASWVANSDAGNKPIAEILYEAALAAGSGGMQFTNPEPAGSKFKVTVSDPSGTTYDFEMTAFNDSNPSTQHFIENIDGMVGESITNFSGVSLTINNGFDAEGQALEIERDRLFHAKGVICTTPTDDRDGTQKPDVIQILLIDNFFADGQSNVIAAITSNLEQLEAAVAGLAEGDSLTVSAIIGA